MEVINGQSGALKPHPQGFPERGRRIDRDDLHAEAPGQVPGEEPVSDALVVPAVDRTQDLPGVEVNNDMNIRSFGVHPSRVWGPVGRALSSGPGCR